MMEKVFVLSFFRSLASLRLFLSSHKNGDDDDLGGSVRTHPTMTTEQIN